MKLIKKWWENVEAGMGAVCLLVCLIVGFINVVTRYIFKYSIPWGDEVMRYLSIWMCFSGAGYAFKMGANVGVEFIINKFGPKGQLVMNIIVKLLTILYFALILIFGAKICALRISRHQVSTAAEIPMWIPYFSMPLGATFVIVRLTGDIIKLVKDYKKGQEVAA